MFKFARPRRSIVSMASSPMRVGIRASQSQKRSAANIIPRRSVFSLARLPLKVENRARKGQIGNIARVRFQPARRSFKSYAITILAIYVGIQVYVRIVFLPVDKALSEIAPDLPDEALEEEGGSIFIPFPGTTKEIKPKPYRGSDPEWQEFIKFSKDQNLAKSVRDDLAQFVRQLADKHPMISIRYGKGIKLRRYWLDVDFPTHPPPEFERSGIEVADEFVAWSTMPVDSSIVFRVRQVLWPSAMAQSLWAFTKVMVIDDTKRLARKFGIQGVNAPPTMDQILEKHQALLKANGIPTQPTQEGPSKPKQPQPLGESQKTMVPTLAPEKESTTGKGNPESDPREPVTKALLEHCFRAILAFKQKFAQTWRPAPGYPPRGSITVSGLVELDAPKAWLVFDVVAAWDPKTKTFDPKSTHLKLRRMQMKKQGPLGGS